MKSEGVFNKDSNQEDLIREAFVHGELETIDDLMGNDEKEMNDTEEQKMIGWGRWAGEGIKNYRKERKVQVQPDKLKPTVSINKTLDRKVNSKSCFMTFND